ncbi:hypothetical protein HK100_000029 [Physocladia obscura]|uniref:PIN domain-containing protein n=1 Tax=Physocladia obscura TaxID=109957 RepID=A0AAD5TBK2_9FUNG|nr:hypothetical protein HK100_000029 [Physocladia obscura]
MQNTFTRGGWPPVISANQRPLQQQQQQQQQQLHEQRQYPEFQRQQQQQNQQLQLQSPQQLHLQDLQQRHEQEELLQQQQHQHQQHQTLLQQQQRHLPFLQQHQTQGQQTIQLQNFRNHAFTFGAATNPAAAGTRDAGPIFWFGQQQQQQQQQQHLQFPAQPPPLGIDGDDVEMMDIDDERFLLHLNNEITTFRKQQQQQGSPPLSPSISTPIRMQKQQQHQLESLSSSSSSLLFATEKANATSTTTANNDNRNNKKQNKQAISLSSLSAVAVPPPKIQLSHKYTAMIVIDTNFWISHGPFCKSLLSLLPPHAPIMVPKVVIRELDGLKNATFRKSSQGDISVMARYAGNLIYQAFISRAENIVGQRDGETLEDIRGNIGNGGDVMTNDDRILDYARFCQQKFSGAKVVLLSNDKNLCTKAMIESLETISNYKETPESFVRMILASLGQQQQQQTAATPLNSSSSSSSSKNGSISQQQYPQQSVAVLQSSGVKPLATIKTTLIAKAPGAAPATAAGLKQRQKREQEQQRQKIKEAQEQKRKDAADRLLELLESDKPEGKKKQQPQQQQKEEKREHGKLKRRRATYNESTDEEGCGDDGSLVHKKKMPAAAAITKTTDMPGLFLASTDTPNQIMMEILEIFAPSLRPSIQKILETHHINYHATLAPSSGNAPAPEELHILKVIERHHAHAFRKVYTDAEFLTVRLPAMKAVIADAVRMRERGGGSGGMTAGDVGKFLGHAEKGGLWRVCVEAGYVADFARVMEMVRGWKERVLRFGGGGGD